MGRTLTDDQVADLAAEHERARRDVVAIDPVTRRHPGIELDDSYAIQKAWVDLQVENGATIVGRKIGLTSRAMQMAMNIDEPDFGTLLDHMVIANGATIHAADHLDPKLEVEFAFVLSDSLDRPGITPDDVYAATDHVVGAAELIDARSHRIHPDDGRTRTVRDTISDNAANSGIVVTDQPIDVETARHHLRWAGAICTRNDIVEETGLGAGVLGDPVIGVVWLANRLHHLGLALQAGETVLAGSFTRPVDCRAGDRFDIDFGRFGRITLDVD